ncbi:restriction endonuclease subunit S [Ferrovum myxofaciens]|uniref:restriction endonuclease subunit S n=1 Tax=Ferrovum myxofaciens TaxID=416213 RepID=UPI002353D85F|nr:restriction endonuclease subunit S [Ferrovum myxofaciens]MBU6993723.1 restriction endonuclease subunit S [Ferrovum myxofaciens]
MNTPLIDISPNDWAIIRNILQKNVPQWDVWAFGSRSKWTAKEYSDLDLAIITDKPLPLKVSASLSNDFSESDIPWKVDVVDWATTRESFRKIIERDKVVVQKGARRLGGWGMASEWQEIALGDFAPFTYGKSLPEKDRKATGAVLVFGSNGIVGLHDKALTDGPTIVIGRKGTVGAIHYNKKPCWPIDTTFFISGVDEDLVRFRYYALKSLGLEHMNGDSAVPGLNRDTAHAQILSIPTSELEQRAIARVLGVLDDRIEHNRALATNLEAIARRLFKSWFVDFDPVRAKAAGEKPIGLADDIAALFPDRFVESELGEIPEEWKVGKVSDFCTNIRVGCTPSQFSSDDFYVGLEHFDRHCLTLWNGGSGDDATSNKSRFEKYDLLFGKLRPYFHKVAIAPMNGICSTDILVIRCADMAYREFMYFTLFQDDIIQFVSDASGGTRMPRTNWETLANYDCAIPPETVSTTFGEITTPMIEIMMQCVSENDALAKLRDLLLPRLISGKLRVEDAESIIEEAIA